jgi:hypothetical protein
MRKIIDATISLATTLTAISRRARSASIEEPLAGVLRAEQIAAVSRLTPMAMTANILSAALVAWAFWADPAYLFVVLWAALLVAASGLGLVRSMRQRARAQSAVTDSWWGFPIGRWRDSRCWFGDRHHGEAHL